MKITPRQVVIHLNETPGDSRSPGLSPRFSVQVVFTQDFPSMRETFEAERQIKGWSRAKKRTLIDGTFDLLPELARNHQVEQR